MTADKLLAWGFAGRMRLTADLALIGGGLCDGPATWRSPLVDAPVHSYMPQTPRVHLGKSPTYSVPCQQKVSAVSACNRCHLQYTLTEFLKGMLTPQMAKLQPQLLFLLLRLLLQCAANTVETQHELPGLQQCFASLQEHLGHNAGFSVQLHIAPNQN